ncbi:Phosphoglycerate kinase [Methanoregula boonei 6A8]|jgi:phosphoglycerate kinase|uniref:Phosphoglycerate kinase n=1 Tax=Methanoregula boonei (strain DSM 21154 / JCM 14090 / 6A8) TaxID=456442 RepID=A7IAU5_METB6|nr:phosphoglycerate kinase [Methanoregula boonei]ABS56856.1 Phosphoglycerate kinase [Methanoregula boonei 6A8]
MPIGTLPDLGAEGKTVLLRLDLNSPIDPTSHLILDDKRFREHLPTVRALSDSRVVIVTHQSRPGKKDFTTLEAHAGKLEELLGTPVTYIDSIFGKHARDAVQASKPGDILMLENVRFAAEENLTMKPEDAKKTHIVRRLSSMADVFVNDAFGTAHRSQPTVVGLPLAMRSAAGLLMEREVATLSKVLSGAPRPVTMVLGGTKIDDSIEVAAHVLANGIADNVIVIGVVANAFYIAAGYDIGKPSTQLIEQLKYQGEIAKAKAILDTFGDRVILPSAVAVRQNGRRAEYPVEKIPFDAPVMDLGMDALPALVSTLKNAGTVVFNGPAGVFEDPDFATGTYELLRAASKVGFSVVGGGHTAAVIEKLGIEKEFTHISTGGGACIEFLTGKKLPAVEALEESYQLFG